MPLKAIETRHRKNADSLLPKSVTYVETIVFAEFCREGLLESLWVRLKGLLSLQENERTDERIRDLLSLAKDEKTDKSRVIVQFVDDSDSLVELTDSEAFTFHFLGRVYSRALAEAITAIAPMAFFDVPIIIEGETGTGKEILARSIHESTRRQGKFVPIHCAGLKPSLAESQLFGHEKGAFTGASAKACGLVEQAKNGTLFLDEVEELDLQIQAELLRFLNDGSYRPVGATNEKASNARIIVASNKDLRALALKRFFRMDLYMRLGVGHVFLPSLRDQPEAIFPMFKWFIEKASPIPETQRIWIDKSTISFDEDVVSVLVKHDWPGNYRELRNCAQNVFIQSLNCNGLVSGELVKKVLMTKPSLGSLYMENSIKTPRHLEKDGESEVIWQINQPTELPVRTHSTGNFEEDYKRFREHIQNWEPYEERITEEAERKLALIQEHGYLPGQNLRRQIESLKDISAIERCLIGRRVILAVATETASRESLAEKLGFVEWKHDEEKIKVIKRTTFSTYLKVIHLVDEDFMRPYKSKNLKNEELIWLEKHRDRGT